jgi:hypothetical protein
MTFIIISNLSDAIYYIATPPGASEPLIGTGHYCEGTLEHFKEFARLEDTGNRYLIADTAWMLYEYMQAQQNMMFQRPLSLPMNNQYDYNAMQGFQHQNPYGHYYPPIESVNNSQNKKKEYVLVKRNGKKVGEMISMPNDWTKFVDELRDLFQLKEVNFRFVFYF